MGFALGRDGGGEIAGKWGKGQGANAREGKTGGEVDQPNWGLEPRS